MLIEYHTENSSLEGFKSVSRKLQRISHQRRLLYCNTLDVQGCNFKIAKEIRN